LPCAPPPPRQTPRSGAITALYQASPRMGSRTVVCRSPARSRDQSRRPPPRFFYIGPRPSPNRQRLFACLRPWAPCLAPLAANPNTPAYGPSPCRLPPPGPPPQSPPLQRAPPHSGRKLGSWKAVKKNAGRCFFCRFSIFKSFFFSLFFFPHFFRRKPNRALAAVGRVFLNARPFVRSGPSGPFFPSPFPRWGPEVRWRPAFFWVLPSVPVVAGGCVSGHQKTCSSGLAARRPIRGGAGSRFWAPHFPSPPPAAPGPKKPTASDVPKQSPAGLNRTEPVQRPLIGSAGPP